MGRPDRPAARLPARRHGPRRALQAARGGALGAPPRARARPARPRPLGLGRAVDVPDVRGRSRRDSGRARPGDRRLGRALVRRAARPRAGRRPSAARPPRGPARPGDSDPPAHRDAERRGQHGRGGLREPRRVSRGTPRPEPADAAVPRRGGRRPALRAAAGRAAAPPHVPAGDRLDLRRDRGPAAAARDAARADAPPLRARLRARPSRADRRVPGRARRRVSRSSRCRACTW